MTNRFIFANWTLAFILAGCLSSGGSSQESEAAMDAPHGPVVAACIQTECQASVQSCRDARDLTCSECRDIGCAEACSSIDCGTCDGSGPCETWNFAVPESEVRDEALYGACNAMVTHMRECGQDMSGDPCEVFARTEKHAMIDAYECFAALPCGADTAACAPIANEQVAQSLADHMQDFCDQDLDPDWRAWVADATAWMRPDSVATLDECLHTVTCTSYTSCLDAWTTAVSGATPPSS